MPEPSNRAPVDMSPEAVRRWLEDLRQLHELWVSLKKAKLAEEPSAPDAGQRRRES